MVEIHFSMLWSKRHRIFQWFLAWFWDSKNPLKMRCLWLQSIGKWISTMCMTQKPKFHRLRNWMNTSRKKFERKNNFPKRLCFPSAMSRFHKSTKMGFPRNPPKMVEFHENRKSSEMVVRGWYMTHFDRRDLQKSKKLFWGRFRITSDFSGPICEISWFFH